MKRLILTILVSSLTITLDAHASSAQDKCTDKVAKAVGGVDGESVPAYIEACYDAKMLKAVLKCTTDECVLDAIDFE